MTRRAIDRERLDAYSELPTYWRATVNREAGLLAYLYDVTGRYELYVQDLETGAHNRVTDGEIQRNPYEPIRWDPSGDRLYVHQNAPGADIHALTLEDGTRKDGTLDPVLTDDGHLTLCDVSPDGRYLLYTRRGDPGHRQLLRYDREQDASLRLSRDAEFVFTRGLEFDPAGERVAFAADDTDATDDLSASKVFVIAADGSERRHLAFGTDGVRTFPKAWGPSGRRLLVYERYGDRRSGVYDLQTDEVTWYGDGHYHEKPITFLPDGDRFLAIRKTGVDTAPVVYPLDGDARRPDFQGVMSLDPTSSWDIVLGADELLLPQGTPTEAGHLVRYDVATDESEPVATVDYGPLDPSALVDPEYVTYESMDGVEIGGLLYEPVGATEPRPAIVIVHGGPHSRAKRRFDWRAQLLVELGYVVFLPNYRGSVGRGLEFKRRIHADLGGCEADDIAAASRFIGARSTVDGDRVALYGHSYGGYLAALQSVTDPDRWDAVISSCGAYDLVAAYANNPDMPGLHEMGHPEDDPELLRERSPVTHAGALGTPLLILYGVDDAHFDQAQLLRQALREAGHDEGTDGDFEYHELGERHGSMDPDGKARRWELALDFLGRRL